MRIPWKEHMNNDYVRNKNRTFNYDQKEAVEYFQRLKL